MTNDDTSERNKAIGARIVQARESKSLRQADFARAIGVTATTLWRYERGDMAPGAEILRRMDEVTKVTIDWLVTGEGEPPAKPSADAPAPPPAA